ncbi:O-fut1 [Bugula neritina]|uniref:GDP-fucose protein O-fucosyltransferase 1 n=1 Tax=Bugula neritina TaxID=10212 RepID=A0A7J7KQU5_BUGNE|nr:O-fut1 [Bugula neritina]
MQIPFDTYFKVAPLLEYHRVILMQTFMDDIAGKVWPVGKRTVFCHGPRDMFESSEPNSCNAKEGNPFGPFWNAFGIDFDGSEFYGPLSYTESDRSAWRSRYPANDWPVLAFTGAPANFPVSDEDAKLHKHLVWSDVIASSAQAIINNHLPKPFIGIHLRIGSDWSNVCKHLDLNGRTHLFASRQCLGTKFEYGTLTETMCMPDVDTVTRQLTKPIHRTKAKSVFLARDSQRYDSDIAATLKKLSVSYHWLTEDDPHLDLAILGQSDHFIGNCISTFSAFATRERRAKQLPVSFWGFNPSGKDEL